ncbi:MAG TPA: transcriptional repressor LexA [Chloroflexota bacterium]|nr:transcriptional repressor LexA [Chloroflexota bacterium]
MQPLTDRQRRVLEVLREWFAAESVAPTYEEIGRELGGLRPQDVRAAIVALERKGYVTRGYHQPRSLRLVEAREGGGEGRRLPIRGTIAAGAPIEVLDVHQEHVWVEAGWVRRPDTFALRVKGNSMIGDGILEDDLVVVEPAQDAANGQTVVALLADGSVTLKRLYRERGYVRLQPANPQLEPIIVPSVTVQGIVVAVLRRVN